MPHTISFGPYLTSNVQNSRDIFSTMQLQLNYTVSKKVVSSVSMFPGHRVYLNLLCRPMQRFKTQLTSFYDKKLNTKTRLIPHH